MDGYEILFDIVDKANIKIQKLREAKRVGKNLDCQVIVEYYGDVYSVPFSDQCKIFDEQVVTAWCNVSEALINVIHPRVKSGEPLGYDVYAFSLKDNSTFVQCGRCWKYHRDKGLQDNLCVRCYKVVETAYPEMLIKS